FSSVAAESGAAVAVGSDETALVAAGAGVLVDCPATCMTSAALAMKRNAVFIRFGCEFESPAWASEVAASVSRRSFIHSRVAMQRWQAGASSGIARSMSDRSDDISRNILYRRVVAAIR